MPRSITTSLVAGILMLVCICGRAYSVSDSQGQTLFDMSQYEGKVVYLDFWASWCGPCHQSFPVMNDLHEEFGDELVIVAVNVDENRQDANDFLELYRPDFKIVFDQQGKLAEQFNVPTMPTSFLFSREGQLIKTHRAFRMDMVQTIKASIAQALQ